jgi:hypothetical protein
LTVHQGLFKDRKSNHGIAEEEQEVCLEREMYIGILESQGDVDKNNNTKGP